MKVAVAWNNDHSGIVNRFGRPSPERYGRTAVENVANALGAAGHDVLLCEADKGMVATLERFMPPDAQGQPTGMVFNMAYGIQGEARYTHVPGMLELAGIPYTGSSPLGHALALDKVITKRLIRDMGLPTPAFRVMRDGGAGTGNLRFPVVVKPLHESTSLGLQLVHDREALPAAVRAIVAQYDQPALVEEYVEGREICVGLLGNESPEVLPFVEHDFGSRAVRLITFEDKQHRTQDEPVKVCPAPVVAGLARELRDVAIGTFHACHCRDYARVDFRVDREGHPWVLEINSMAALGASASYAVSAGVAGYSFGALVQRILDVAHRRAFGFGIDEEAPARLEQAAA